MKAAFAFVLSDLEAPALQLRVQLMLTMHRRHANVNAHDHRDNVV
jgi:hypothetical protein